MSLWTGQKLLVLQPDFQVLSQRAEEELLESSVCSQDNSSAASPREEGAATLRMFLPVPAKQAKELPRQEPVGQTGPLKPNTGPHLSVSRRHTQNLPCYQSTSPAEQGPDSQMLEGPLPGPAGAPPPPAFSPFSKQCLVSSSSCSVCEPTLSLAVEMSLDQRPSLVLQEKVSKGRDKSLSPAAAAVTCSEGPDPAWHRPARLWRLRGPIPQPTPGQGASHTHRPGHTRSHRNPGRATMHPQNASVQPGKPQHQPLPHGQMHVNMQPPVIGQKGKTQTGLHTKT